MVVIKMNFFLFLFLEILSNFNTNSFKNFNFSCELPAENTVLNSVLQCANLLIPKVAEKIKSNLTFVHVDSERQQYFGRIFKSPIFTRILINQTCSTKTRFPNRLPYNPSRYCRFSVAKSHHAVGRALNIFGRWAPQFFSGTEKQILVAQNLDALNEVFLDYDKSFLFSVNGFFIVGTLDYFDDQNLKKFLKLWILSYEILNIIILKHDKNSSEVNILILDAIKNCGADFKIINYGYCSPKNDSILLKDYQLVHSVLDYSVCPIIVTKARSTVVHIDAYYLDVIQSKTNLSFRFFLHLPSAGAIYLPRNKKAYMEVGSFIGDVLRIYIPKTLTSTEFTFLTLDHGVLLAPEAAKFSQWKCLLVIFSQNFWKLAGFVLLAAVVCDCFINYGRIKFAWGFFASKGIVYFGSILGVSFPSIPKYFKNRIFMICWIIYCFHFVVAFQARYFDLLNDPPYQKQIESWEDMIDNRMTLFATYLPSGIRKYDPNIGQTNPLKKKGLIKIFHFNINPNIWAHDSILKEHKLVNENTVVLIEFYKFGYLHMEWINKTRLVCNFQNHYFPRTVSYEVYLRHLGFVEIVNFWIHRLHSSGFEVKFFRDVWFGKKTLEIINQKRENEEPVAIKLSTVSVPFKIWAIGLLISAIIFVFEKTFSLI